MAWRCMGSREGEEWKPNRKELLLLPLLLFVELFCSVSAQLRPASSMSLTSPASSGRRSLGEDTTRTPGTVSWRTKA